MICEYAQRLCDKFGVKKDNYKQYVEKEEILMDIIKKAISKTKKIQFK